MVFKKKEIIFGACDSKYFMIFGISFVSSSLFYKNATHIHIVNPTTEVKQVLLKIKNKNSLFTFSSHKIDLSNMEDEQIKGYYISMRFLIIPHLFKMDDTIKIMVIDIDSIIRKPILIPTHSLGIFLREYHKEIEFKVMAGVFLISHASISFIDTVNLLIQKYKDTNTMKWYMDQISIYQAYQKVKNKQDIYCFTQEYYSWDNHKDAYIWTGKGSKKYTNKLFLKEKKHFEDIFRTLYL